MIRIPRPDDFHCHLRQGPALKAYTQDHARVFGRALVMPNTLPPIINSNEVQNYRAQLLASAAPVNPNWQPLMTIKIVNPTTIVNANGGGEWPGLVAAWKAAGVVAAKLYPAGVTTNSADGVRDLAELYPLFAAMQDAGLVLCIHGEDPDAFCLDRELAWLPRMNALVRDFPKLKIVIEHVSTSAAINWVVSQSSMVAATITVQHLLYNLDDMLGAHLKPHLFCKPLLKRPQDQAAIQAVVLQGQERFFFGSDSAPHARIDKECDCGAAGVYSAPVAMPLLAGFFEAKNCLERLGPFTSQFGCRFYGLPESNDTICLDIQPWTVPSSLHSALVEGGVVPLAAGTQLKWKVV